MFKPWSWLLGATLVLGAQLHTGADAATHSELTATEQLWLEAAKPVLTFGRAQGLPLDILVQPQATPGETPMGLAWVDGRCKLVLSMRGNPQAQALLDRIPQALLGPVVEAIAAHELAHCWRHVQQLWGRLPADLDDTRWRTRVTADQAVLLDAMWCTRREEGFADLVGLAWTLRNHAARYDEVLAWHAALREIQVVETGPHDTRVWVRLARDRDAFTRATSLFEQVQPLWEAGLRASP
jgi:hypothetical protein